jgi:hypothetical protein
MCRMESSLTLLRVVRAVESLGSGHGLVGLQPTEARAGTMAPAQQKRPADCARKVLPRKNWRTATTVALLTVLPADEDRMSSVERVPIHTHLGVANTVKTGRPRSEYPRLLNEVHIPFAVDRDEVSCTLVAGPCLVDHFCGHIGKTPRG